MRFAQISTLFVLIFASAEAVAGPWVNAPGEGYAKVSGSTFSSDQVVDADGVEGTTPWTYSNQSITTYFDVGIAPRVGLNLTVPFQISANTYDSIRYERSGLGDLGGGLSVALLQGRCPVSLELSGSVPLYDGVIATDAEVGAAGGTDPTQRYLPLLGDGATEFSPGFSAGCSLYPVPAWITASVAYQVRNNGFGDGIKSSFGVGGYVWPERVALVGGLNVVQRLSTDVERPTKSYLSAFAGVLVAIGAGFSAEATASLVPGGVFVSTGTTYSVGISYTGRLFPNPY
ncbi:MAG: hypothetical protein R3E66_17530 [bacterium]